VHSFTHDEVKPLVKWINERHAIYMRKAIILDQQARGATYPALSDLGRLAWGKGGWTLEKLTDDPILQQYRFCNVFRELDRVTVWIRENIREPFAEHEHLWFMLAAARFINWPETLNEMINHRDGSWPADPNFTLDAMTRTMEQRKRRGDKVETGAYMIRAESDPKKPWYSWPKQRYIAEIVLGRPWRDRATAQFFFAQRQRSLRETWEAMKGPADWVGWGPFMAGQVVADLRHTRYLRDAPDVGLWAPLGPGSMRGLNRLAGRSLKQAIGQAQGLAEMLAIRDEVNASTALYVPPIELHDIQNCLCEVDKYLRVQSGEGKPRAGYVPGRGY
jgi:hypothetical protein